MCNRYESPEEREIERVWRVGRQNPGRWWDEVLYPRGRGPFIRRAPDKVDYSRELVFGQWGLIPHFAKSAHLTYSTNNARSEDMVSKPSYRLAWATDQRCIIPALSFDEPNWESGRNIWWRFRRTDGQPWALAGLWNTWLDRNTGEIHESYTMLTMNADMHPLISRMHKPDPALPADRQDKRSVIPIEQQDVDQWLFGSKAEALKLVRLPTQEEFIAGPG